MLELKGLFSVSTVAAVLLPFWEEENPGREFHT